MLAWSRSSCTPPRQPARLLARTRTPARRLKSLRLIEDDSGSGAMSVVADLLSGSALSPWRPAPVSARDAVSRLRNNYLSVLGYKSAARGRGGWRFGRNKR